MRVLLLVSSFNGLTQRTYLELLARRYEVTVELAISAEVIREAIRIFRPDVIVCPFLKDRVPEDVWRQHLCIIVHPGIKGDRGPSSLDWAILEGEEEWGVTALQAAELYDAGDIWSTRTFPMRPASKSSLYRGEVTQAAVEVVLETLERLERGGFSPEPLDYRRADVRGREREPMKQIHRRIDWSADSTELILRKIRAADGSPGVLDSVLGLDCYLYGAHPEGALEGYAGEVIAVRDGAICRATIDGAVWLSHLKRKSPAERPTFKLPAAMVLGDRLRGVPEIPLDPFARAEHPTLREIWYREIGKVGVVHWDFYNGAMGTEQCRRLRDVLAAVKHRPVRALVLAGGREFWSNGIHLNLIEAAEDPGFESMRNIEAIDDVVREVLSNESQVVITALGANAGAGGVMAAAAGDVVFARRGVVLNPHYESMGLYGSEYWTYTLPRRVGAELAAELTQACLPISATRAAEIGLADELSSGGYDVFLSDVLSAAQRIARKDPGERAKMKRWRREQEQADARSIESYREAELAKMRLCFFAEGSAYHPARKAFVYKQRAEATPAHLARHRGAERKEDGIVAA